MATAVWYHRDISRVQAEDLLARAGRDGSFLVRDSESVPGAYALCLLFQRHVHTYRILPDMEGLLAVQTSQGVQVNCFRTLADLVVGYQQPHKGLVAPLLYPVGQESEQADESSADGDDEKPGSTWNHSSALPSAGAIATAGSTAASGAHVHFLHRLQEFPTPSLASDMVVLLSDYLRSELPQDMEDLCKGSTELRSLQRTLSMACEGLRSEIDLTLSSLETLAKVFDHPTCPLAGSRAQNTGKASDSGLDGLVCKISALCSLLSTLEKRVLKALQEAVANHNLAAQPEPPPEPAPTTRSCDRPIPVHTFQVKVSRYGRQVLSADVDGGVLLFDRKSGAFGVETVSQDRILKLVRFRNNPGKLCMVLDNRTNPPRELLFESIRKCEAFCHLLQLMRTRQSRQGEPDLISVFVGTWNMGSSPPPRSLQSWLLCRGLGVVPDESTATLPHDIYAFGTQENTQGDREWAEQLRAALRSVTHIDFKLVVLQSLWNMRLAVFVRPEHEKRISHISSASVKTGLGNTLGNKGAVGASFLFNGTSLGFVNCHLTSGTEKAARRNQNFQDILRLLSLGDRQLSAFDISLRFTHVFWCGDLNYRLDLDVQDILKHILKREFEALMCADQLTRERHKRKVFLHFNEEKILFPPTYRYERGSRECYLWQKYKTSGVRINVPSWCDRVLWKSYPETHIACTAYGCTDDITTSDHSPVFATFQVGVASPFLSKTDAGSGVERAWIELESIEVILKTASKAKFFIEFHSYCLEEFRRSGDNDSQSCEVPGFLKLGWSPRQLPKLIPIVSDKEYLQDQHLLLSVKSCDSFESYGWLFSTHFCCLRECSVALRSLIGSTVEVFETFLTHRGEEMGSIRGRVMVHVPKDRRQTRERTYEWFCFENDENSFARSSFFSPTTCAPIARTPGAPPAGVPPTTTPRASVSSTPTPSSYTNPAYFMFEGVPVQHRVLEDLPTSRDPRVVWARDSVLQLPKVCRGRSCDGKPTRRSDFTEIEIPGCLPHCRTPEENLLQSSSSYQLFPAKEGGLISASPRLSPNSAPRSAEQSLYKNNGATEPRQHSSDQRNIYMNHSALAREMPKPYRDPLHRDRLRPSLDHPSSARKSPALYPYASTRVPRSKAAVPWMIETQTGPPGDNSLTALQIAKSLSEVDFLPVDHKTSVPNRTIQQKNLGYELAIATERGCCWEKEPLVLHGAPETVQELLSTLGLQRYTLGLSLNGWDDLDYFSGITEEDLRAAGVTNPAHRRRILENLPRIWD
ncbi:inositol polyphosphate phosphatase-like 1b isoform X1 [Scleropages formosus]|uniref:inositol polyphosphate phosphatase-like 1b isoform X1 n=1 Tax=Scleropages formosus TaxID=113540 RepID=UPI0010FA92D9|nr:phosphatidylinositol 3,4,5-trisphosphate 5-phosphatase 2B-like isoform X1 [Scleropages formosus]